jgi:hypothetical protein
LELAQLASSWHKIQQIKAPKSPFSSGRLIYVFRCSKSPSPEKNRRYELRRTTFAGFLYDYVQKETFEDTEEEREAFYEKMYENGGFEFWLANYKVSRLL